MLDHLKKKQAWIIGLSGVLVLGFQNCSDVNFDQAGIELKQNIDGYLTKRETVVVNFDNAELDILFVIDNSGSMSEHQKNMKDRIGGFMSHVDHLKYQIAVTSTDRNDYTKDVNGNSVPWGDGQFRSFDGGTWQILSYQDQLSTAEAETLLGDAIQMGSNGDGSERGVRATYRTIERASDSGSAQFEFFRENSSLAVVLISDEDECSDGSCLSSSSSDDMKSRPEELHELIDRSFGSGKVFTFHSILHPKTGCVGHAQAKEGKVYKALSESTGGIIGNVCATDYAAQLSDIGELTETLIRAVQLECAPEDVTGDGKVDLDIYLGVQPVDYKYTLNGDRVTFEAGLPSGEYTFDYYCKSK